MDLWRSAETGVGPSMAAGSHGCNVNCALFPAAAKITPKESNLVAFLVDLSNVSSFRFHVLKFSIAILINNKNPVSPIRL